MSVNKTLTRVIHLASLLAEHLEPQSNHDGFRGATETLTHRLRQVHGDFHPLEHPLSIRRRVLAARSFTRRIWGSVRRRSVADYELLVFLAAAERTAGGVTGIAILGFWQRYLETSQDREMLKVVAPFLAFRGFVMASPLWCPSLPDAVRQKLLAFIFAVLENDIFDPHKASSLREIDSCESFEGAACGARDRRSGAAIRCLTSDLYSSTELRRAGARNLLPLDDLHRHAPDPTWGSGHIRRDGKSACIPGSGAQPNSTIPGGVCELTFGSHRGPRYGLARRRRPACSLEAGRKRVFLNPR